MSLYLSSTDIFGYFTRKRYMIPPRSMIFVGNGDYRAIGLEFRDLFIREGGLKPTDKVLDVGCGVGRMASPLTTYLDKTTEYHGFDIVDRGITWCVQNIASRYPNFHFSHADVINASYNPTGTVTADSFDFPFPDNYFDFIFLTSVFTHMFPRDLENYLKEIARVLKPGKTCFITFFLMNEEAEALIQAGASTQNFIYPLDGCWTTTPEVPEEALAFREDVIISLFETYGLTIQKPIRYGSWNGRSSFLSYQDIVVATKN